MKTPVAPAYALNERKVDRYLSNCTDDVRLESPVAAIEGAYEGPDGIRRSLPMSATRFPTSASRSSVWTPLALSEFLLGCAVGRAGESAGLPSVSPVLHGVEDRGHAREACQPSIRWICRRKLPALVLAKPPSQGRQPLIVARSLVRIQPELLPAPYRPPCPRLRRAVG